VDVSRHKPLRAKLVGRNGPPKRILTLLNAKKNKPKPFGQYIITPKPDPTALEIKQAKEFLRAGYKATVTQRQLKAAGPLRWKIFKNFELFDPYTGKVIRASSVAWRRDFTDLDKNRSRIRARALSYQRRGRKT